jgi:hypothetical protein
MTERQWRRRMLLGCAALTPLGLAVLLVGVVLMGKGAPSTGYLVGSAGVLSLAFGALFGKFAIAGPVPDRCREGPQ